MAARFKGKRTLLDISIRGEYAVSRKGDRVREKEKERKREAEGRVGQGEWLFLREGAGKRLRDGVGIREEKQEEEEEEEGGGSVGEEGGSNRVACNFEMDSAPHPPSLPLPSSLSSFSSSSSIRRVASLRSLPLHSFLRTRLVGWINSPFLSAVARDRARREERKSKGERRRKERMERC